MFPHPVLFLACTTLSRAACLSACDRSTQQEASASAATTAMTSGSAASAATATTGRGALVRGARAAVRLSVGLVELPLRVVVSVGGGSRGGKGFICYSPGGAEQWRRHAGKEQQMEAAAATECPLCMR